MKKDFGKLQVKDPTPAPPLEGRGDANRLLEGDALRLLHRLLHPAIVIGGYA